MAFSAAKVFFSYLLARDWGMIPHVATRVTTSIIFGHHGNVFIMSQHDVLQHIVTDAAIETWLSPQKIPPFSYGFPTVF